MANKNRSELLYKRALISKVFTFIFGFGVIGLAAFSAIAIQLAQQSSRLRILSTEQALKQHPDDNAVTRPKRSSLVSREQQRGSWIGDVWIPPKAWTLFSASELAALWGESTKGVLWIGDSTARRSSLTMWEILNGANQTETDVPKYFLEANEHVNVNHGSGHTVEKCTKWPRIRPPDICRSLTISGTPRPFVFKRLNCYHGVTEFLEHELSRDDSVLQHVDTIILSLGLWDITLEHQCFPDGAAGSITAPGQDRQQKLLDTIKHMPERFTILWRTTSYGKTEDVAAIDEYNKDAMDTMDSWWTVEGRAVAGRRPTAHYVDFARAIFPRSFGKDRIQGDHYAHYGSTARVVMVQMLSNRLRDLKTWVSPLEPHASTIN